MRAVQAVLGGEHPESVAAALGMHRTTVYGWVAKYHEGGWAALKARPVPGRVPSLSEDQLGELYTLVAEHDPRQLGFDVALWTREMVRVLIEQRFAVRLAVTSVGRILKGLGLSAPKPLWRAYQADPDAVERWKSEEYPTIARRARKRKATIYFADEASVRSDYHRGTTWAPTGRTPIVPTTGARFAVNMISAISAKGALRFSIVDGTLTAARFIDFCRRLLHDAHGPVFLILDGHPVHRSTAVAAFAESTGGMLTLFRIPAYSPHLNPDEWVWKNVKSDRVGRSGTTGPDRFQTLCTTALRSLQRMPHLVRGFFAAPDLADIRAVA